PINGRQRRRIEATPSISPSRPSRADGGNGGSSGAEGVAAPSKSFTASGSSTGITRTSPQRGQVIRRPATRSGGWSFFRQEGQITFGIARPREARYFP